MAQQQNNYQLLIKKLDEFIRKYYANQLIRGALYSVGLILFLFLLINLLEYQFFFAPGTRKILFFSFIGISGLALFRWVIQPALHYFNLGMIISHEQAAVVIGEHFANVKDKLLNILQLKQQGNDALSRELVQASIDQKIVELNPVPFKAAIDLGKNKKYLRYALPPLVLLLFLSAAAPDLIPDSTSRLFYNGKEFERPAPFTFSLVNENLDVIQFEDFPLEVKVTPTENGALPEEVFINVDNYEYKLKKTSPSTFEYQFSKVAKDTRFNFQSSGFSSKEYDLNVLKKPNIASFELRVNYPSYTGRKDETLQNIGDLVVPEGTSIRWSFESRHTDDLSIQFGNSTELSPADRVGESFFSIAKRINKDLNYKVFVSNEQLPFADSVAYALSVVQDLYPSISVEQFVDSVDQKLLFFVGDASDDYGLKSLSFNYRVTDEEGLEGELQSLPLGFESGKQTQYDHTWDLNNLELNPGDQIVYYFEVFDNDGVKGSKSARTSMMTYRKPTIEEFEELEEANNEEIKDDLKKSIEEAKDLRKDLKDLKEKLLQKKELDWQDRKEIEKMLERQKELEENLEKASENFDENLQNQEEFEETKESILDKQEKIQELFEELMSDEMKELMQKMEELLNEMNRDDALMELEDMELNDEQLEKELDRMLELFKQLEMEHQLEQTTKKLDELAEKQEELSEETKENENNLSEEKQQELEEKQQELNEEFEKVQEDLEKLDELNQELSKPKELGDTQEQSDDIEQDMQNSSQELQEQKNQKASKSQKNASQKMKKMSDGLKMQMQAAQMQQMQEDMESLRQLLENLVELSFDEEEIMNDLGVTTINTPQYVKLVQDQYKIKDDFKLVEDSLQALSKRVFQIEAFVTEKVVDIKKNLKTSIEELEERKKSTANVAQQYAMTGINDLALMLSEVMDQMQQQMASAMSGSQMCENPGNSKGQGMGQQMMQLGDMQQQLNDQITKMQEALKNGKQQGNKSGRNGMSKQFAEMAAKQAAIRKALEEMQKEKQGQGKGDKALQELIEEMDKTETDLVNKRLNNSLLKRQNEILTRLLESAKAEREREYDQKRKSETAQQIERQRPPSLEEYIKKREAEIEQYKTVSPNLKPFYKNLVEDYFKSLQGKE